MKKPINEKIIKRSIGIISICLVMLISCIWLQGNPALAEKAGQEKNIQPFALPSNNYAVTDAKSGLKKAVNVVQRSDKIADFGAAEYVPVLPENHSFLETGKTFVIDLRADERDSDDKLFDTTQMYYQLPSSGLKYVITDPSEEIGPGTKKLVLIGFDSSEGKMLEIWGAVSIDDHGELDVVWDKNSPGYYLLEEASNANFHLEFSAEVDGSDDLIVFDDEHEYYVDNTADATFTKSFAPNEIKEMVKKMTEAEKEAYTFETEITAAKTSVTTSGEWLDEKGMVRDAEGHIVYEKQTVTFTLKDMTYDAAKDHYQINWNHLKPDGSKVTVKETGYRNLSGRGYSYSGTLPKSASTNALDACSSQACSLTNTYTQDVGTLKIQKDFGQDSDITKSSINNTQKGKVKITVKGTAKNGSAYTKTITYSNMTNGIYEIRNIPAGTYTVTEEAKLDDYNWIRRTYQIDTGAPVDVSGTSDSFTTSQIVMEKNGSHTVTLENTYVKGVGSLAVSKSFDTSDAASLTDAQEKSVSFSVRFGNQIVWFDTDNRYIGTTDDMHTPPAGYTTANAFCSFSYAQMAGGSENFTGLPAGQYTVQEANMDFSGYSRTTTHAVGGDSYSDVANNAAPSSTVTIHKDSHSSVAFKNTYKEAGSLKLTKSVTGLNLTDAQKKNITFTLERYNASTNTWVQAADPINYLNLASGKTFTGLPYGRYRVTETVTSEIANYTRTTDFTTRQYVLNPDGTYTWTASESKAGVQGEAEVVNPYMGSTGEVQTVNAAEVNFSNKYAPITTELKVQKDFSGSYMTGDADASFRNGVSFTVKNGSTTIKWNDVVKDGVTVHEYNSNGTKSSFTYADMASGNFVITGLPVGKTYTVTENNSTKDGYTRNTTVSVNGGTSKVIAPTAVPSGQAKLEQGKTATISFDNSYTPVGQLKVTKKFSGILNDEYCNSSILPNLYFQVSTVIDGTTYYVIDKNGTLSATGTAYKFPYSDLADGLRVVADKTYTITEYNTDCSGVLSKYVITTWSTVENSATGAGNQTVYGGDPQAYVGAGETATAHFTNDYRSKAAGPGVGEGAGHLISHKTWTGLDNGPSDREEGAQVKASVRFELYRSTGENAWYLYDTYTLQELTSGEKEYEILYTDGTTGKVKLPIVVPAGTYKMVEVNAEYPGYVHDVTLSILFNSDPNNRKNIIDCILTAEGIVFNVAKEDYVEFSLDNVYRPLGNLIVTKTIDQTGNLLELDNDQKKLVSFALFNSSLDPAYASPVKAFDLGSAGISYDAETHTYAYSIEDLPIGFFTYQYDEETGKYSDWQLQRYNYTVIESNTIAGYTCVTTVTIKETAGESSTDTGKGTLQLFKAEDGASTAEILFSNKYIRQTGVLMVTKGFSPDTLPDDIKNKVTFEILDENKQPIAWSMVDGQHVYSVDGTQKSFTYKDMNQGSFAVSGLPTGSYYVRETNADSDAYIRTTSFTLKSGTDIANPVTTTENGVAKRGGDVSPEAVINDSDSTTVQITNAYTPIGSIKVEKTFSFTGFASMTEAQMKKIAFALKNESGVEVKKITLADSGVTMVQNPDGAYTFSYIFDKLPLGNYTVTESNADPLGYTRTTTVTVLSPTGSPEFTRKSTYAGNPDIGASADNGVPFADTKVIHNATKTMRFANEYSESGSLTMNKTFSGMVPAEEAADRIVFTLKDAQGNILPDNDGKYVYGEDGATVIGTVTYARLPYTVHNLAAGTYTVAETILGESNRIADTDSTFFGYVHTKTEYTVSSGKTKISSSSVSYPEDAAVLDPVTASGPVTAAGVSFDFTNTYQKVPELEAEKSCENYPEGYVFDAQDTDYKLPVWKFTVVLKNLSEKNTINGLTTLKDTYDAVHPEWFKLCTLEGYTPSISGGSIKSYQDNGDGTASYEIAVKNESGVPAGETVVLTYYLQVKDKAALAQMLTSESTKERSAQSGDYYESGNWIFTNTIEYHPLPTATERDTARYYYKLTPVQKSIQTEDGSAKVLFTLRINPEALRIGPESTLTIYDKMSDNIMIDMTSFKVSPVDQTTSVRPREYTDSDDWDVVITVPNETALTITYEGMIIGTGTQTVTNKAVVNDLGAYVSKVVVLKGGGGGSVSVAQINLYKYGNDVTEPLPGAVFGLYEAKINEDGTISSEEGEKVNEYTSNTAGKVIVRYLNDGRTVEWNKLYYLKELKAPEGYILNSDRIYFRIVEEDPDSEKLEYIFNSNLLDYNRPFTTKVSLQAKKTLSGKSLTADSFSFQLLDENSNILQTKKNAADGSVRFDDIPYAYTEFRKINPDGTYEYVDEVVHTYTVREAIPNGAAPIRDGSGQVTGYVKDGYTYDITEYTATVPLKLNEDKTALVADTVYTQGENTVQIPAFHNLYAADGSIHPTGSKILENANTLPEQFVFEIKGAGKELNNQTITVKNAVSDTTNSAAINYPTFQYVIDSGAEDAAVGVQYDESAHAVTTTVRQYADLAGYATLKAGTDYDFGFQYVIGEQSDASSDLYSYDNQVYTYTLKMKDGGNGKLQIVPALTGKNALPAGAATLDFVNQYYGSLKINKQVTLGSKATDTSLVDGIYSFTVYTDSACTNVAKDKNGREVRTALTITNGAAASAAISGLIPGTYYVKEETEESTNKNTTPVGSNPIAAEISKDVSAEISAVLFTNDRGVGSLRLRKTVTGTEDKTKSFSFTVTVAEAAGKTYEAMHSGNSGLTSVTFNQDGKVSVSLKKDETILIKGLPQGAEYSVLETAMPNGYVKGNLSGGTGTIQKDTTVEAVQVNEYSARGNATLRAQKNVTGDTDKAGYPADEEYEFKLGFMANPLTTDTNNVLDGEASKKVKNGEKASWTVKYDTVGTYYYTVTETKGNTAGVTYDPVTYYAIVDVTDNRDGTLSAAVTYGKDLDGEEANLTITNQYSETTFAPEVKKTVDGENSPDESFTFSLTGHGCSGTASCKANKTAVFAPITFHQPGTYTFEISETAGSTPGMTYSTEKVICTVVIEKAADGKLSVKSSSYSGGSNDDNTVTNTYVQPTGKATLQATKAITGNAYSGENQFAFVLAFEENPLTSETNNIPDSESGAMEQTISVDETAEWIIDFDQPGTYYYTIQEQEGTEDGMAYDTAAYFATVVMHYSEDGKTLVPDVTYGLEKDAEGEELIVTNQYSKITFAPEVRKLVKGSGVSLETFHFTLKDDGGYTDSASCKADETAAFSEITYYDEGEFTYTIQEDVPKHKTAGMTYSRETVTVTLKVNKAEDGTLQVSSQYTQNGTFTNTYNPPEPGYDYNFTFKKVWMGGIEESMEWTLYNANGTVAHKKFNKKIVSDTEWHYNAWFDSDQEYFLVENVPAGYKVRYENVGEYADITDRCYDGGTIVNYKVPKTGDSTNLGLWLSMVLTGIAGLTAMMVCDFKRRKANR